MKKQISPKLVSLIFAVLVICFALGFYIFAWTEPTADPPLDNVLAPLNVSYIDQTKTGALTFSEFRDANGDTYYINPSGVVSAVLSGSVGIGATSPSEKLDVDGNIVASGTICGSAGCVGAGGGEGFGVWNDRNKDGVADKVAAGVIYTAATDGLVVASLNATAGEWELYGYTPAGTLRARTGGWNAVRASITMPVKKNDTWKVEVEFGNNASADVYWMPIGN